MSETTSLWVDGAFWVFGISALVTGWRVFETGSMVRATFLLLLSFVNVGAILLLLSAEYLGFALLFMMAIEMVAMATFMVMFMMDPAGLNPMEMVHQKGLAILAGAVTFAGLGAVAVFADFPQRPVGESSAHIRDLGLELLGDSMMVFESAGVALLTTMIAVIALTMKGGRYGDAVEGSCEPELEPPAEEDR